MTEGRAKRRRKRHVAPPDVETVPSPQDDVGSILAAYADLPLPILTPLYALPTRLIQILGRNIKPWFSSKETRFELKLATLAEKQCAIGYIGQIPLFNTMLCPPPLPTAEEVMEAGNGSPPNHSASSIRKADEVADLFREQSCAYLGWLVTNLRYQEDLAVIRRLREEAGLPVRPFAHAIPSSTDVAFHAFKRRWCLIDMTSWDLPIPQGPNLAGIRLGPNRMIEDGASVEIPATVSLPANFDLRDVMHEQRDEVTSEHLQEWNAVLNREGNREGIAHYARLFRFYFWFQLAFCSRYAGRLAGRLEEIDHAFGEFMHVSEASIKRLRLRLVL